MRRAKFRKIMLLLLAFQVSLLCLFSQEKEGLVKDHEATKNIIEPTKDVASPAKKSNSLSNKELSESHILENKSKTSTDMPDNWFSGSSKRTSQVNLPAKPKSKVGLNTFFQMLMYLVFIILIIYIVFFLSKNKISKNLFFSPGIELLSKTSLFPKQTISLVRVGTRILVLSSTADGQVRTLSEISNEAEVAKLIKEVRQNSNESIFQSLLKKNELMYDEDEKKDSERLKKVESEVDRLNSDITATKDH